MSYICYNNWICIIWNKHYLGQTLFGTDVIWDMHYLGHALFGTLRDRLFLKLIQPLDRSEFYQLTDPTTHETPTRPRLIQKHSGPQITGLYGGREREDYLHDETPSHLNCELSVPSTNEHRVTHDHKTSISANSCSCPQWDSEFVSSDCDCYTEEHPADQTLNDITKRQHFRRLDLMNSNFVSQFSSLEFICFMIHFILCSLRVSQSSD